MKFLYVLLLVPGLALAGLNRTSERDCTDVDLRNDTLGSLRDQKEVAWCYAFAGADMLGYTFGLSEKISAADVAIGYNTTALGKFVRWVNVNVVARGDAETLQTAHQTGFNKFSLDHAMKEGWCPESVFPSETWIKRPRLSSGNNATWGRQAVPLKEAMLEIYALYQKRKSLTSDNLPFYYEFKNVGADEFLALLNSKNLPKFYSGLRQAVCQHDRVKFDQRWKTKMVLRNANIFKRVNEQLDAGRLVGLDFDSTVTENIDYQKLNLGELHTVSLVARRWNSSQQVCEYLIRNSYGTTCERYDRRIDCQNGHQWMSEARLYPTMTSVVYLLAPRP